jgi:hypothetical protein
LDLQKESEDYSLEDCFIYFYWIWHLEGAYAVGIRISEQIF